MTQISEIPMNDIRAQLQSSNSSITTISLCIRQLRNDFAALTAPTTQLQVQLSCTSQVNNRCSDSVLQLANSEHVPANVLQTSVISTLFNELYVAAS